MQEEVELTLDTGGGRVLEGVLGKGDAGRPVGRVRNVTDLGGTLAKVGPLVGRRVGETVGHGTVGAVDDTGGAWVLDTGDGLLIWVHGLREEGAAALGLMTSRLAEELRAHGL